ncbi:MAG: type I toxin-antitoxin system Fst family toxin [Bacteroidota bacterium]|nr:type I toxin-antitoxin system Fst family toxin [Bacteroidota bacterium]
MCNQIFELVIIPIFVGIVIELFAYWLNKRNDD